MKEISIVIPTYNEKNHLINLLESIKTVNYPTDHYEVIIVSDGSTDGTPTTVQSIFTEFTCIALEKNIGRYNARKKGVEKANFDHILFVDSRTLVDPEILNVINHSESKAIKGYTECGNPTNPFYVLFESIRYKLYPDFYRKRDKPFIISSEIFEKTPKGTGVFYVSKDILNAAYEELSPLNMGKISSDDTQLIKSISNHTPVEHHPGVKIIRYMRESFIENFLHLIYRGSTFVYYYLHPSKHLFWLIIVFPIIIFLGMSVITIIFSVPWYYFLFLIAIIDILIATFLGNNLSHTLIIMLMLPISTIAFYLGIVRGVFRRLLKIN